MSLDHEILDRYVVRKARVPFGLYGVHVQPDTVQVQADNLDETRVDDADRVAARPSEEPRPVARIARLYPDRSASVSVHSMDRQSLQVFSWRQSEGVAGHEAPYPRSVIIGTRIDHLRSADSCRQD
jgi:hypothetical protein